MELLVSSIRILKDYRWHLLIFMVAFIVVSTLTLPKLFVNDEWITVNQLAQIDQGHQVIFNEGKYGSFENGTPYNYFTVRGNRLGYTILLPLLSLPVLKIIHLCGDLFLYLFLFLLTIILIVMAYFLYGYFPDIPEFHGRDFTNVLIIAAFLFFFLNMVFFSAFSLTNPKMPAEVAAIGLTNLILLCLLTVILFDSYETAFTNLRISIPATVISLCCSSYIFWTTTAKDHILVAFLAGLLIWCGIRYLYTRDDWYIPIFFLIIGYIAWARAEIALPIFVIFSLLVLKKAFSLFRIKVKKGFFFLFCPFFTVLGSLPFFINNYFITNNPLMPPFIFNDESILPGSRTTNGLGISHDITNPVISNGVPHFLNDVMSFYTPPSDSYLVGLLKILFLPQSMAAAVCVLCPLLLIGLLLIILGGFRSFQFSRIERQLFQFLGLFSLCILIAYVRSWSGMPIDVGIMPDMRYFSPLYIPFSMMGIILIRKCRLLPPVLSKNGLAVILFTAAEIFTILIIYMIIFRPADLASRPYFVFISGTSTSCLYALTTLTIFIYFLVPNSLRKTEFLSLLLCSIISVPLVWQIGMIFVSSIIFGTEGYFNWIPVMKVIFQSIQNFIISGA